MKKVEQAAANNAIWIATVCRTHKCTNELNDSAWYTLDPTPSFYPNAVTIRQEDQKSHLELAEMLVKSGIRESFAIKDSFQCLDLEPLGYNILFDSQWIYKPPIQLDEQDLRHVEAECEEIKTASALREWESAWAYDSDTEVSDTFLPALLDDKDVLLIAIRRNKRIVAGCIANVGAECVGFSNLFLPPTDDARACRHLLILKAHSSFPNLPLVGYESGKVLEDMQAEGFTPIGTLRVWFYEPHTSQS